LALAIPSPKKTSSFITSHPIFLVVLGVTDFVIL